MHANLRLRCVKRVLTVQRRECTMSLLVDQPLPPSYRDRRDEMAEPLSTSRNTGWSTVSRHPARNRRNPQLPRGWFQEDDYVPATRAPNYNNTASNPPPQKDSPANTPKSASASQSNSAASSTPSSGERLQGLAERLTATAEPKPPLAMKDRTAIKRPAAVCARVGDLTAARIKGKYLLVENEGQCIVDELKSLGSLSPQDTIHAIQLAAKVGRTDYAEELLASLERPNARAYTLLMSGYAGRGDFERVQATWSRMKKAELEANVFTYNVVLNCFAEMGDEEKAVNMLSVMEADGVMPDAVSYNTALRACRSIESAMHLLRISQEKGIASDKYTLISLLEVCLHCGDADAADLVLNDMASKNLLPDTAALNILMRLFLKLGQYDKVLGIFNSMLRDKRKPDHTTYELLMEMCVQRLTEKEDKIHQLSRIVFKQAVDARLASVDLVNKTAELSKKAGATDRQILSIKNMIRQTREADAPPHTRARGRANPNEPQQRRPSSDRAAEEGGQAQSGHTQQ